MIVNKTLRPKKNGFSLIELMIVMLISTSILTSLFYIIFESKRNTMIQSTISTMNDHQRFISDMIYSEVKNSKLLGCNSSKTNSSNNDYTNLISDFNSFDINQGLVAIDGVGSDSMDSYFDVNSWHKITTVTLEGNDYKSAKQSDILQLWSTIPWEMNVTQLNVTSTEMPSATLAIDKHTLQAFDHISDKQQNQLLLISDCKQSFLTRTDSFTVNSDGATLHLQTEPNLNQLLDLQSPMSAFFVKGTSYYVGKLGGKNSNPPTLYKASINAFGQATNKEPIFEGIANLQLFFETQTTINDQIVHRYIAPTQVNHWMDITGVGIYLLMETVNDGVVLGDNPSFSYLDKTYASLDRRLRQEAALFIDLAN